jgi:hypothetical protein
MWSASLLFSRYKLPQGVPDRLTLPVIKPFAVNQANLVQLVGNSENNAVVLYPKGRFQ